LKRILVLGGARSGKSTFAERLAAECGEPVLYVATATVTDDEMAARIARHRAQRPASWRTLEEPLHVAQRVATVLMLEAHDAPAAEDAPATDAPHAQTCATVLIEDLTLLLSNLMAANASKVNTESEGGASEVRGVSEAGGATEDTAGEAERAALEDLSGLLGLAANVVLVSNEVGMGIVPPYPLGRVFRDALGRLNQAAAGGCDEVYLLVAGLPLRLK
jgi:adenosylcobinamide kinase / adenosylcobinamide-phosphate guanylyltransferase